MVIDRLDTTLEFLCVIVKLRRKDSIEGFEANGRDVSTLDVDASASDILEK